MTIKTTCNYTPQNELTVTHGLFHMLCFGSVLWGKPDNILKKRGSAENEALPINNLTFKIFIFIHLQNSPFLPIFLKNHVLSFLLMSGLCDIKGTQ